MGSYENVFKTFVDAYAQLTSISILRNSYFIIVPIIEHSFRTRTPNFRQFNLHR